MSDDLADALKAKRTAKQIAEDLRSSIAEVEQAGYVVQKPRPQEPVAEFDDSRLKGRRVRLAIVSDTHMGSKYQQLTALRDFCAYAKRRKVDAIIHAGDVTDGPPQMHPGHLHNLFLQTYDSQRQYAIHNLPKVGNIPWYVISGNHDESWLKNNAGPIVEDICHERSDLNYMGQSNGYVSFGDTLVMVNHPHTGINTITLSRPVQRIIETLSPENKPNIVICGNWHKACHIPGYRNVEGLVVPSYQSQTPFMRSKALVSVVGGVIIEFGTVPKGLAPSVQVEWVLEREVKPNDWP